MNDSAAPPPPPEHPPSTPPPPIPQTGDATGGLIPYKNPQALTAYYLGIFGLFPAIGLLLAIPAVILGILGLKAEFEPDHQGRRPRLGRHHPGRFDRLPLADHRRDHPGAEALEARRGLPCRVNGRRA